MSESTPEAEGTAEQGTSDKSLPAETPVGPDGTENDPKPTPDPNTPTDQIQPREVTDENPIVEGETPEGLTREPIEGDPQPTDWGNGPDTPDDPESIDPDQVLADARAAMPDDHDSDPEAEYADLDLGVPAPHAPYDPTPLP